MKKNKVRFWELLGLAAVLIAIKVSSAKPKAAMEAKENTVPREAENQERVK